MAKARRFDEAVDSCNRALAIQPGWPAALTQRGNALAEMKMFREAIHSYNEAIAADAHDGEAWCQRGLVKHRLGDLEKALEDYNKSISLDPANAVVWSHRGIALQDLDRIEEAVESYDRAIAINPCLAEAWSNRGVALKELARIDEAIASYEKAVELKPAYADAYWNKALACLIKGDFADGLPLYEWRWKKDNFESPRRDFSEPVWLGDEPLEGKTILLHSEQGFGDTLQFCRYIPRVRDRGGTVVFEVEKPLASLLGKLPGISSLIVKGEPLPPFDYHCPLLSLPLAFGTTLCSIPCERQYLTPDPEKVLFWRNRLGKKSKPRIGLAWAGSPKHRNDRNRSLSFDFLAPLLEHDCDFISLQLALRDTDRIYFASGAKVAHFGDTLTDFSETAALCACLDLVITVDTSIAHLSGALGQTTWTLLPHIPDWRWLLGGTDSPWYPTMKLYRQPRRGDWKSVQQALIADLSRLF
jgi:Flp pilus assembly protein TadD